MSVITELANCTATIARLSPTTGTWATITGGSSLAGILDTRTSRASTPGTGATLLGESFTGQGEEILTLAGVTPVIYEGDRITITPTGGSARQYRAQRPRVYPGILPHQEIPLGDYAPGGS